MLIIAEILVGLSILPVAGLAVVLVVWRGNKAKGLADKQLYPPHWLELILNALAPVLHGEVKHPRNIAIVLGGLTLITGVLLPAIFAGCPWLIIGLVIDLVCFVIITWAARLVNNLG